MSGPSSELQKVAVPLTGTCREHRRAGLLQHSADAYDQIVSKMLHQLRLTALPGGLVAC